MTGLLIFFMLVSPLWFVPMVVVCFFFLAGHSLLAFNFGTHAPQIQWGGGVKFGSGEFRRENVAV